MSKLMHVLGRRVKAKSRIIILATNYHLSKIRAFDLDPDLIREYEEYARKVFVAFA